MGELSLPLGQGASWVYYLLAVKMEIRVKLAATNSLFVQIIQKGMEIDFKERNEMKNLVFPFFSLTFGEEKGLS